MTWALCLAYPNASWCNPSPSENFMSKHPSDSHSYRPYLSVFQVFHEADIERRHELCKIHKYCRVCTSSIVNKLHSESKEKGKRSPKQEQFKCRECPSLSNFSHCDLLCYTQAKRAHGNNNQRGRGWGDGGDRGVTITTFNQDKKLGVWHQYICLNFQSNLINCRTKIGLS